MSAAHSPESLGRSRWAHARRASVVLGVLGASLALLALVWSIRADSEPVETAAEPRTPHEAAAESQKRDVTLVAPIGTHEVLDEAAPARLALEQGVEAPAANRLASVHVRVIGLGESERARVEVLSHAKGRERELQLHETDERGLLSFAVPAGELRLAARTDNAIAPSLHTKIGVGRYEFDLSLQAAARVTGRVTNALDGTPIAGARITTPGFREIEPVLSGANGEYTITALPDGMLHALHCTAEGFGFESTHAWFHANGRWRHGSFEPGQQPRKTELRSGPASVDFALLPERTISGSVRGVDHELAGASVRASGAVRMDWGGLSVADEAATTSDASGAFTLRGLRPDIGHQVLIRHSGHAESFLLVPASHEPRQEVGVIRLERASRVDLVVLDGAGTPIEHAHVLIETPLPIASGMNKPAPGAFTRDVGFADALQQRVRTSIEGRASFPALAPGSYSVRIAGYATDLFPEPIEVSPGSQQRIELRVPLSAHVLGRVIGPHGPVEGARVFLHHMDGRYTSSRAGGHFVFAGVAQNPEYLVTGSWTDELGVDWKSDITEAQLGEAIELVLRSNP